MRRLIGLLTAAMVLGIAASAFSQAVRTQTSPSAQAQDQPAERPTDPSVSGDPNPPAEQPSDPSVSSSAARAAETPTDPTMPSGPSDSSGPAASAARGANPRLAALTPAGISTREACAGFKTTLQCATTLHASQNLNIPFADLKAKVIGGQQLSAAILELKPGAAVIGEVQRAAQQARADLQSAPRG